MKIIKLFEEFNSNTDKYWIENRSELIECIRQDLYDIFYTESYIGSVENIDGNLNLHIICRFESDDTALIEKDLKELVKTYTNIYFNDIEYLFTEYHKENGTYEITFYDYSNINRLFKDIKLYDVSEITEFSPEFKAYVTDDNYYMFAISGNQCYINFYNLGVLLNLKYTASSKLYPKLLENNFSITNINPSGIQIGSGGYLNSLQDKYGLKIRGFDEIYYKKYNI